jgi:Tol biopolymer transport system component
VGSPAWSPNGEWIAFDGSAATRQVIYKIPSEGGQPHFVADGFVPRWSRDGKWLYYSKGDPSHLYRVSAEGGEPQLLSGTRFGMVPEESPDGWVYYSGHADSAPTNIRRTRPGGGDVIDVFAERIAGRNFVVVKSGIWYMTPSSRTQGGRLRFYDFASKLTRTVYQTNLPIGPGLTLTPNGRRILFTHRDRTGSDLMLIENFRRGPVISVANSRLQAAKLA